MFGPPTPARSAQQHAPALSLMDRSSKAVPPASREDGEGPHHLVVLVLDDVAVVYVALRGGHPFGQVELCADGGEVARVGLDGVLEAALAGRGPLHRAGRERLRTDP